MVGCGMVATIQTDWETDRKSKNTICFIQIHCEQKEARQSILLHIFFSTPCENSLGFVMLYQPFHYQKHVKARDSSKRICVIVIFYEVCLFLFLENVILKKTFHSLELLTSQNRVVRPHGSAVRLGEYVGIIDFLTQRRGSRRVLSEVLCEEQQTYFCKDFIQVGSQRAVSAPDKYISPSSYRISLVIDLGIRAL